MDTVCYCKTYKCIPVLHIMIIVLEILLTTTEVSTTNLRMHTESKQV